MNPKSIDQLNRRLGEELGFISEQPRFAWRWAPELRYYSRAQNASHWTEHNWADMLGNVWVLTSLRPPVGVLGATEVPITEQDWYRTFRGTRPFPGKLTPYVFAETALIPGLEPSAERTAFYIDSLKEQMSKSVARLEQEGLAAIALSRDENKQAFFDEAAEWFPFGWGSKTGAHIPGTRGGAVAFQR